MSNLQLKRKAANLTQRELAERSGVPLRTLQYYEQGVLDINKASAATVCRLALALECDVLTLIDLAAVLNLDEE